jgi:uncharacterized protein (UPF0333 family)
MEFALLFPLLIVAVAIAFFFVLPTGIVQAVTNQSIGKDDSLLDPHRTHLSP